MHMYVLRLTLNNPWPLHEHTLHVYIHRNPNNSSKDTHACIQLAYPHLMHVNCTLSDEQAWEVLLNLHLRLSLL